ncbi:sensor domain-containing diguanylate cyclase [Desulfonatronovibrio hydrogenovorans]|uniref:sensor domain-containing diguanylate cyclase n=1 Tax=Desulfonatronovibrio hydrogenovorans TaxID=53245 RepID=UPI000A491663|nr:diguanylate cyclase [Desulfonatronovibrio hydrogenovorans]
MKKLLRFKFLLHPLTIIVSFAILWSGTVAYLNHERQKDIHNILRERLSIQQTALQATLNQHKMGMGAYFTTFIMQPEIMGMLQVAREGGQRETIARSQILSHLTPLYKEIFLSRDIQLLHFHTPDKISFLRLHSPERFGDSLAEVRPGIRIANTELKPVHGFEIGIMAPAFRNIFPIIWNNDHLGSVELSQPLTAYLKELADLDREGEHAFLINRSLAGSILLEEFSGSYKPSLIHPNWVVETPDKNHPYSPLSGIAKVLGSSLSRNPHLVTTLNHGQSGAFKAKIGNSYYTVAFTAIHDIAQRPAAYLVSFAPAPQIKATQHLFLFNLFLATVLMIALAWSIVVVIKDRERVRKERTTLRTMTNTMAEGLYVVDQTGRIAFANPAAESILGYKPRELVGKIGYELFVPCEKEKGQKSLADCPLFKTISRGDVFSQETRFQRKDGTVLPVQVTAGPMIENNRVTGGVSVFSDISARKKTEEKLHFLATTDELTGLWNRRYFMQALNREMERAGRYDQRFSLLMLDIDHFKKINDQYGHAAGDQVLEHLAGILKASLRQVDVPGRLGGEEFAIILPQTDQDGAYRTAERLRTALEQALVIYDDKEEIKFTVSVGLAVHQPGVTDQDQLLKMADQALYRAKEQGRNQTMVA